MYAINNPNFGRFHNEKNINGNENKVRKKKRVTCDAGVFSIFKIGFTKDVPESSSKCSKCFFPGKELLKGFKFFHQVDPKPCETYKFLSKNLRQKLLKRGKARY